MSTVKIVDGSRGALITGEATPVGNKNFGYTLEWNRGGGRTRDTPPEEDGRRNSPNLSFSVESGTKGRVVRDKGTVG